jgi:hypothetical protein
MDELPTFTDLFGMMVVGQALGRLRQDQAIESAWAINDEAEALERDNAERLARILRRRQARKCAMSAIISSR